PVFDFVHYRDSQGRPDSVDIDPVLTYDIIANTLPPVIKRNVRIRPGERNVIKFNTPRGTLQLSQKGSSSYPNGVRVIIKDLKGKVINVQPMNSSEQYIAGEFQIETLTLPREFFKVVVKPRQTEKVTLPAPGIVNIYNNSNGYGSMYEIDSEGR
ncbi:MAG: hypothetical protein AAFX57_19220, partial [Bacteroidota bacterium]